MKLIPYDQLIHDALRQVVREVLIRTQEKGLPGDHHFYISFETKACEMAVWLKKRYPKEMTIVIQKQYENLIVEKNQFAITLYFDNRPERLCIPFKAMVGFTDPHASFSLRMASDMKNMPPPPEQPKPSPPNGQIVDLDSFRKQK